MDHLRSRQAAHTAFMRVKTCSVRLLQVCRPPLRSSCFARAAAGAPLRPAAEQPLREWLAAQGGFLHPDLRLVDSAPCGARGVLAAAPISLEDLEECGPLVVRGQKNTACACMVGQWHTGPSKKQCK